MKKVIALLKGRIFEQPWKIASGLLVDFRVYTRYTLPETTTWKYFPQTTKVPPSKGSTWKSWKNVPYFQAETRHLLEPNAPSFGVSSSRDSRCCGLLALSNDADLYQIGHRSDVPVVLFEPSGNGPMGSIKTEGYKKTDTKNSMNINGM